MDIQVFGKISNCNVWEKIYEILINKGYSHSQNMGLLYISQKSSLIFVCLFLYNFRERESPLAQTFLINNIVTNLRLSKNSVFVFYERAATVGYVHFQFKHKLYHGQGHFKRINSIYHKIKVLNKHSCIYLFTPVMHFLCLHNKT